MTAAAPAPDAPRGLLRWTLARRMAVLALVPAALVTAGGSLWLRQQMHQALHDNLQQVLQEKLERLSARLRPGIDGRLGEPAGSGDEFSAIYSGWYWQASGPDGAGRSRSLWDAPPLSAEGSAWGLSRARGPLGQPLLGLERSVQLPGLAQPVRLTVFGPAGPLYASLQRMDRILLTSAALLIGLLTVMLMVQVRLGLAPLRRLVQAIAALYRPADPASASPSAPALEQLTLGPDLAPLQRELTALLAHNTRVVERARGHAADLNHALKKPLALLSASASRQPLLPAPEVLQQVTEMTRLIDRYQARTLGDARPAQAAGGLPAQAVAAARCLDDLLQAMRKLHAAQALDWQLRLPPDAGDWHLRGDRTDVEEALGNLLDNAGKWAASQVRVSAAPHAPSPGAPPLLRICIEDDGPGMSAAELQAAGQRGLRFDESVQGTGLGLAIASQIATAWGGALHLGKSDSLKGLCASLHWPLASAPRD